MKRGKKRKTKKEEAIAAATEWRRSQRSSIPQKQKPNETEIYEICKDASTSPNFFGCYLLTSLSPRYKGHSYIGFTVNPKRRIRQHNGELTSGASHTKKKRPWEMVFLIHGFPSHVSALQFEWAWQHPSESLAVREAASSFKTLGGLANKIKLALTMLTLPSWNRMALTVSFFSTKYMKHTAGSPTLPHHMKLHFCSMDDLPCYCQGGHPYHDDHYDFGDLDDDIPLSSFDDASVELNHSLTVNQSCNTPDVGDDIWTWDQSGIGGRPGTNPSSLVEDTSLNQHVLPFDQVFSDAHGSTRHPAKEQVQVSTEMIAQGMKVSSSLTDEHADSFHQVNPLNKDSSLFHTLDYAQPLSQFRACSNGSAGNSMNERLRLGRDIGIEGLRGSFPIPEDDVEPFYGIDPPLENSSSMVDFVSATEKFTKINDIMYVLVDDSTEEQRQPTEVESPFAAANNTVLPSSNKGVEVVDLFTPSPDCRITAGSKKRRVVSDSADIIDLTKSPLFVQL